jgi:hypothetical protein
MKEKFPLSLITEKIGGFINKLVINNGDIKEVKNKMMNIIFNDMDVLNKDSNIKYKFIIKLLDYEDIKQLINSVPYSSHFITDIKERLLPYLTLSSSLVPLSVPLSIPSFQQQPQITEPIPTPTPIQPTQLMTGGSEPDITKDLFYTKICRLFDIDIPDKDIIDIFMKYLSEMFAKESPEKAQIYQKIMGQTNLFIDQIFKNAEFQDAEFRKYMFYILLDDPKLQSIIESELLNNADTSTLNTDSIKTALTNNLNNVKGGRKKGGFNKTIKKRKRRKMTKKQRY